ncbi:MAG: CoA-binding protein [Anaerolineae bacterium]|nr:CoA-binding protein [Anaerolineae bacterium]
MTTKASVDSFTSQPALALVGVSRSGNAFSNATMKELREKGYTVYPINRNGGEVNGEKLYTSLAELPQPVGGMLVMVASAQSEAAVREAAAHGVKHVWLQQGSESPAAIQAARDSGIDLVHGECILMFAGSSSFHGFHRFINKIIGKLPK